MDEASEEYLIERLSALCLDMSRDDLLKDERDDEDPAEANADEPVEGDEPGEGDEASKADDGDSQVGNVYSADVTIESFNDVKVQFTALGLIERGTKRRPGSDTSTYWRLTDRGHQQLLRLRAIRRVIVADLETEDSNA